MSRKILIIVWCFLWATIYALAAMSFLIPLPLVRPLSCFISIFFIFCLIQQKLETVISAYLLSFGISVCLFYTANFLISFVSVFFMINKHTVGTPIDFNQPIYIFLFIIILVLQLILTFLFFRIRRFRKGFPFIFNKFTIVAALIFTGIILTIVTWNNMLSKSEDTYAGYLFFAGVLISGIGIYILIRRLIKRVQENRRRQNREEHLEKMLFEKEEEIKRLNEKIIAMQTVIHKFTHRIESMENVIKNGDKYQEEFSDEIAISIEDIKHISQEYQNELAKIKGKKHLPSTNIKTIDNLFEHFAQLFAADRIDFKVAVNGSIVYMVDNIIPQNKLETMIGDHLQDALIAVNASDNTFRSVLAIIGLSELCYEFTVFDSGIPFEATTLMRLGTEHVTTHVDTGGSGIGFMTTFETMRECKASLIINEKEPSESDYTKSVTMRFDEKNRYIIETYRSEDIMKNDEKYIVVSIP